MVCTGSQLDLSTGLSKPSALALSLVLVLWVSVFGIGVMALDNLKVVYCCGRVAYDLGADRVTLILDLRVENPSFSPMMITANLLSVKLKSGNITALFFNGHIDGLSRLVPSDGFSSVITLNVQLSTSTGDSMMPALLDNAYNTGLSIQVRISGILETKYLLLPGKSAVDTGWHSIIYAF